MIELATFADDLMWRHFSELYGDRADQEMQQFLLAAINNVSRDLLSLLGSLFADPLAVHAA
jgi:hypothetical protein